MQIRFPAYTMIPRVSRNEPADLMQTDSKRPQRRPRAGSTDSAAAGSQREVCPKCGSPSARVIGRAEAFSILYFRCDECRRTSVGPV